MLHISCICFWEKDLYKMTKNKSVTSPNSKLDQADSPDPTRDQFTEIQYNHGNRACLGIGNFPILP